MPRISITAENRPDLAESFQEYFLALAELVDDHDRRHRVSEELVALAGVYAIGGSRAFRLYVADRRLALRERIPASLVIEGVDDEGQRAHETKRDD